MHTISLMRAQVLEPNQMWLQLFNTSWAIMLLPSICSSFHANLSWSRLVVGIFLILCTATPDLSKTASAMPIDTIFKLPSPTPAWPRGRGFAEGTIDLGGGLIVSQVTSFNKIWSAYQWGPDNLGVTFYEPSSVPNGFFMLGGYGQANNKPLFGWVLAGKDGGGGALKKPIDYTLAWSSESLRIKQDGPAYLWLPTPPDGYKAAGYVITNSSAKPSLDKIRCVRSDLTDPCEVDEGSWMWSGNGFKVFSMRPKYRGVEALGVSVGTFVGLNDGAGLPLACLKKTQPGFLPCMPNKDQIEALVRAYAPVIYFHPNEDYLPSSVTWFFNNGALLYKAGEANPMRIEPTGSNLPQGGSNDGAYWLDLPVDGRGKDTVKRGDLRSSRAYFHAKPMLGGTFTDLVVWVFYPFNGPARVKVKFLNIPLKQLGEHVGDWEHVTLRISNFNGELVGVYFSKHNGGTWMRASEVEFQNGNKFVAYASLHGHAFFPHAGLVLQGSGDVGLRNDAARSDKVMDTGVNSLVVAAEHLGVAEPAWINYMRRWGPKISYDTAGELRKMRRGLLGKLKSAFDKFVRDLPPEALGEAGPAGPKSKSNWGGDEE